MKKIKSLLIVSLSATAFLLTSNDDVQASTTTSHQQLTSVGEEISIESSSRYVQVSRFYRDGQSIPTTIRYNSNGYSGTLRIQQIVRADGGWVYIYHGNVTCSGNCPIS